MGPKPSQDGVHKRTNIPNRRARPASAAMDAVELVKENYRPLKAGRTLDAARRGLAARPAPDGVAAWEARVAAAGVHAALEALAAMIEPARIRADATTGADR